MVEVPIPLRRFFLECLDAAQAAMYELILCLVAREGDAPEIYAEVTRYWSSLHDLTGEAVLFVFAGAQKGELATGAVHHRKNPVLYITKGMSVAPKNRLAFNIWEKLNDGTSQPEGRSHLAERHSLQISDLKEVFRLRECDLPCLHVTFLRDRTTTFLPIRRNTRSFSFYSYIRAIMAEAEPHLVELHSLSSTLRETTDKVSELDRLTNEVHWRSDAALSVLLHLSTDDAVPTDCKPPISEAIAILRDSNLTESNRRQYFRLLERIRANGPFWLAHRSQLQRAIDLRCSALRHVLPPDLPSRDELKASMKGMQDGIHGATLALKGAVERASARVVVKTESRKRPTLAADICILTVIQAELDAARTVIGMTDRDRVKLKGTGSVYWLNKLFSHRTHRDYRIALGCIANAGNYDSSAASSEAFATFSPACMILVGIAAGIRGKVRLGQVVLSERVVAYEPASLQASPDGNCIEVPRPEIVRAPHSITQDVVAYRSDEARNRVDDLCRVAQDVQVPPAEELPSLGLSAQEISYRAEISMSTVASGEKLLRDDRKLRTIRTRIHGKTEVGEMEGAGFVTACTRLGVQWLVVRGVSDFGDSSKSDAFHTLASVRAAATAVDFISHGLELGRP